MEETHTTAPATPPPATTTESPSPFKFNSFQQWEIAFIYAFACTFNPQQEIAPSFYKLPEFTPQV
jgi:hypothetical protein